MTYNIMQKPLVKKKMKRQGKTINNKKGKKKWKRKNNNNKNKRQVKRKEKRINRKWRKNIKLSLYMYSIITLPSNKNNQISGLNLALTKHSVSRPRLY